MGLCEQKSSSFSLRRVKQHVLMSRRRTLLEELAELNSTAPQDQDPEDFDNAAFTPAARNVSFQNVVC